MQMPINDQMIVWEKYEVLFLNIVPWSQVSSISFSGTKNALIFSFFFLIVHHIPPLFFNFVYLIILAVAAWYVGS